MSAKEPRRRSASGTGRPVTQIESGFFSAGADTSSSRWMPPEGSSAACATLPLCVTEQNEETRVARQLTLPIPGVIPPSAEGAAIPRPDRVFVNRNLRLSGIRWVGFDMDYTLAIYRQEQMDALSIQLTVERL